MKRIGAWYLKELKDIKKNNLNVFSTFHCGGGSSMGYKLAGCTVLGGVEIDEKMMSIYRANHNPKYSYKMAIQDFKKIPLKEIPEELKSLDILDGSPPCSVFSTAGKRQKRWGKEFFFREGQELQRLDDLFIHFINIAEKLKPKIVIAENVKGLILGNAKGYVKEIFQEFNKAGYEVQLYLLNAAKMGVPQSRERTFFIARQKKLKLNNLNLEFNEPLVSFLDATKGLTKLKERKKLPPKLIPLWRKTLTGKALSSAHPKGFYFNTCKLNPNLPVPTITAGNYTHSLWNQPYYVTNEELIRLQTFPDDFDFLDQPIQYVTGMSVPPFMVQRLTLSLIKQWNL